MSEKSSIAPLVIRLAKLVVLVALIAYLVMQIRPEQLAVLGRPKNWPMFGLAFLMAFAAVSITFARWFLLVRALELRFRLSDAFRLGFLGYLLNFVAPSSVGGDLFKAIFIAKEQKGRRAEAVATVVVDRVIGLYALIVVTTVAILSIPLPEQPAIRAICNMTVIGAVVGGIGLGCLLFAPKLTQWGAGLFGGVPKVGDIVQRIAGAIGMYRAKPLIISIIGGMSLVSHSLFAISMFLIARGLYGVGPLPTLAEHFVIVPLSMVAGAIPLAPGGLGTFEVAMKELYAQVPVGESIVAGVAIALIFRLITIAIAAVGGLYYLVSRQELQSVLQQARGEDAHAKADCC